MEVDKNKKEQSTEYKTGVRIGSLFAYTIAGCVCAVSVGLTVKFLYWLLF